MSLTEQILNFCETMEEKVFSAKSLQGQTDDKNGGIKLL